MIKNENMALRIITGLYLLISFLLFLFMLLASGGTGLGYFLVFWMFQGVSILLVSVLTIINHKKWLNAEYGKINKMLLLSYLIIPLIMLLFMGFI